MQSPRVLKLDQGKTTTTTRKPDSEGGQQRQFRDMTIAGGRPNKLNGVGRGVTLQPPNGIRKYRTDEPPKHLEPEHL